MDLVEKMTVLKSLHLLFLFVFTCAEAHGLTYYVAKNGNDSFPGTQSQPWLSVQKAANTVTAGNTINIGPGTYQEDVTVSRNGTSTAPIVFAGPATAIVRSFRLNGNYITVSGLGIGTTNSSLTGVALFGTGDLVTGCAINMHGQIGAESPMGVKEEGTNCIVYACDITGSSMTTSCDLHGTNCQVVACKLHDQHDVDAFRVWGTGTVVHANEVYNHDNPNIGVWHSDFTQTFGNTGNPSRNIIIDGNYVHDCQIQMGNLETDNDSTINGWEIRNNVFARVAGAYFVGVTNTHFYNNVFYKCGTDQSDAILWYQQNNYDSTGGQIINNIFLECGANSPSNGTIGSASAQLTRLLVTHNYCAGSNFSAKTTAFLGTSAINGGDPKFVNLGGGDFHLQAASRLIDAGTTISSFTVDKDGGIRPHGAAWDIGPYEFGAGIGKPAGPQNLKILRP